MALFKFPLAQQALNGGQPEPLALRYIYHAGTDTLASLFKDPYLSMTRANPMPADNDGRFELCYLVDGLYRVEIESTRKEKLLVEDNVTVASYQDLGVRQQFESISALLSDETFSYVPLQGQMEVAAGQMLASAQEGNAFRVADPSATDHHVISAGGVKMYVLPDTCGARNVRAFGAVGDGVTDDGPALQKALDVGGRLIIEGNCLSNQPLVVEKTSAHLVFPTFQKDRITVGPTFPEGEHLLTVKSVGRRQGGDFIERAYFTGNERYFSADNMALDGGGRVRRAHGLYFAGQVDDLTINGLAVHDFKGIGVCCGDINGSLLQDEFRESRLSWLHIKNCGHLDVANGYNFAAFEMAVHTAEAPIGAINNVQLSSMKIAYPRGVGLRLKSLAPSGVKTIRAVSIDDLFIHGSRSLTGNDPNGEAWHNGADLVEIGHDGATSTQIAMLTIGNLNLVEQEDGTSGIRVYDGSQLKVSQAYMASSSARTGLRLSGAGNCSVAQFLTRRSDVSVAEAQINLIKIDSMASEAFLHIGAILGGRVPKGSPNFYGDLKLLRDDGRKDTEFRFQGDSAAMDASTNEVFGSIGPGTQYINKITLVPLDNLTANDTNFATLTLQRRNLGVTTQNVAVINTKTSGSGGTGNWTKGVPLDVAVTAQSRLETGMVFSLSITKSGTGKTVPAFALMIETSFNVSVV